MPVSYCFTNLCAGLGSLAIRVQERSLNYDADGKARAGIVGVVHVIAAVHVINVDVVGVIPICRPRFHEPKPIAAVLEARVSAYQNWPANAELVFTSKIGMESLVGNSTAPSGTEADCRLGALSGLCFLGALRPL